MKKFIQILLFVLVSNICLSQTNSELIEQNQQLMLEIQEIREQLLLANNRNLILETKLKAVESILLSDSGSIQLSKNNYVTAVSSSDSIKTTNTNGSNIIIKQKRCQAKTAKGNQCSSNASSGSTYCLQHKNYQKTVASTKKSSISNSYRSSKSKGRTIYRGPRGVKYYINSHGKKIYIRH